ncbi:caspase family protein, partial [Escherichia coli]|uniref:caspase family protein n=1 Tax=Escherichia coli TaxID=562 RepID=UPI003F450030
SEVDQVTAALKDANFQITTLRDKSFADLIRELSSFADTVMPGDICFIYYSGYAAQEGEDDLLAGIDFDPSVGIVDRQRAYSLLTLAHKLED